MECAAASGFTENNIFRPRMTKISADWNDQRREDSTGEDGCEFRGEFFVEGKCFAKADENAHDDDVDLDGARAVEDAGEHGDALFGEGSGNV